MAMKLYEEEHIRGIANAIREKNGSTDGYKVSEMADAVSNIPSGGGDDGLLASIIDGTVTEIRNDKAKSVKSYMFFGCPVLTSVNISSATSIESNAFYGCSALTSVDFPLATSIETSAFRGCSALTKLILRNTTKVCTYSTSTSSYDPRNANLKIYVPRDLLEQYKVATNWSRLASKFVALEDYTVDGTTTGELRSDA